MESRRQKIEAIQDQLNQLQTLVESNSQHTELVRQALGFIEGATRELKAGKEDDQLDSFKSTIEHNVREYSRLFQDARETALRQPNPPPPQPPLPPTHDRDTRSPLSEDDEEDSDDFDSTSDDPDSNSDESEEERPDYVMSDLRNELNTLRVQPPHVEMNFASPELYSQYTTARTAHMANLTVALTPTSSDDTELANIIERVKQSREAYRKSLPAKRVPGRENTIKKSTLAEKIQKDMKLLAEVSNPSHPHHDVLGEAATTVELNLIQLSNDLAGIEGDFLTKEQLAELQERYDRYWGMYYQPNPASQMTDANKMLKLALRPEEKTSVETFIEEMKIIARGSASHPVEIVNDYLDHLDQYKTATNAFTLIKDLEIATQRMSEANTKRERIVSGTPGTALTPEQEREVANATLDYTTAQQLKTQLENLKNELSSDAITAPAAIARRKAIWENYESSDRGLTQYEINKLEKIISQRAGIPYKNTLHKILQAAKDAPTSRGDQATLDQNLRVVQKLQRQLLLYQQKLRFENEALNAEKLEAVGAYLALIRQIEEETARSKDIPLDYQEGKSHDEQYDVSSFSDHAEYVQGVDNIRQKIEQFLGGDFGTGINLSKGILGGTIELVDEKKPVRPSGSPVKLVQGLQEANIHVSTIKTGYLFKTYMPFVSARYVSKNKEVTAKIFCNPSLLSNRASDSGLLRQALEEIEGLRSLSPYRQVILRDNFPPQFVRHVVNYCAFQGYVCKNFSTTAYEADPKAIKKMAEEFRDYPEYYFRKFPRQGNSLRVGKAGQEKLEKVAEGDRTPRVAATPSGASEKRSTLLDGEVATPDATHRSGSRTGGRMTPAPSKRTSGSDSDHSSSAESSDSDSEVDLTTPGAKSAAKSAKDRTGGNVDLSTPAPRSAKDRPSTNVSLGNHRDTTFAKPLTPPGTHTSTPPQQPNPDGSNKPSGVPPTRPTGKSS